MKVLIACESSGRVREAFAKLGADAWSCDLLDTEITGNHYKGDVKDILFDGWDIVIAHPPCTYLANSGVHWLWDKDGTKNTERWDRMKEAAEFFKLFLDSRLEKVCIENPVPHKYALDLIGRKYSQTIQPYEFGEMESKRTCLWLRGLPLLVPTKNVYAQMMQLPYKERCRVHSLPPGPQRWKERSRTFQGIADAIAKQFYGYQPIQTTLF